MSGISVSTPRRNRHYAYRQTIAMGWSPLKRDSIERALLQLQAEWSAVHYDLFSRNCATFCDAFCEKLGVGPAPPWITRLGETLSSLPGLRAMAQTGWFGEANGVSPVEPLPVATFDGTASPRAVAETEHLGWAAVGSSGSCVSPYREPYGGAPMSPGSARRSTRADPSSPGEALEPRADPLSQPRRARRSGAFRVDHYQAHTTNILLHGLNIDGTTSESRHREESTLCVAAPVHGKTAYDIDDIGKGLNLGGENVPWRSQRAYAAGGC